MDAVYALLCSFRDLHRRGYERLKVYAYLYETGHWRCHLGVVGYPTPDIANTYRYTSGAGWQFFASAGNRYQREDFTDVTPDRLAELLQEAYPKLMGRARSACRPYAVWYELLLEACGREGYFVMNAPPDYDAKEAGYVQVHRRDGSEARFPLAPAF